VTSGALLGPLSFQHCALNLKSGLLALSDAQLAVVMTAARGLPMEKRGLFLERVAARLRLRDRFTDADLDGAVRTALGGLVQVISAA
jgi:hypothetical protein